MASKWLDSQVLKLTLANIEKNVFIADEELASIENLPVAAATDEGNSLLVCSGAKYDS